MGRKARQWRHGAGNLSKKQIRSLIPPTEDEIRQYLLTEEEPTVTVNMTGNPNLNAIPRELRALTHPLWFKTMPATDNLTLQILIANADANGFVDVHPGTMSFFVGNCTASQFKLHLTHLVDAQLITVYNKNKSQYRLQSENIRDRWLAEQPREPEAAPPTSTTPEAATIIPPVTTELNACYKAWQASFGNLREHDARQAILENFRLVEGKGFSDAQGWIIEAIQSTARRHNNNRLEDPVAYFVSTIRKATIYGRGHVPSAEQDEIEDTFGAEFDVALSDSTRRYLSQLLAQYGALKVMKVILQESDTIAKVNDPSLIYVQELGHQLERTTGQPIVFKREA